MGVGVGGGGRLYRPMNRLVSWSVHGWLTGQLVRRPVGQSVFRSVGLLISRSVSSVDRWVGQLGQLGRLDRLGWLRTARSVGRSVGRSVCPSVCQYVRL
jgi:hypothetical protein